jgi:hypothetical protein
MNHNLKRGLKCLGHDVTLLADGDGYRKFHYDYPIVPFKDGFLAPIRNIIHFLRNSHRFFGNDIVQFIHPDVFPTYYHLFGISIFMLVFNKKLFYYSCGTDNAFLSSRNFFAYFPYDSVKKKFNLKLIWDYVFFKKIHYIIPSMFSYSVGYTGNPKLTKPVPLPGYGYKCNTLFKRYKKIRILYGITRHFFKGSEFILPALEKISYKYSSLVDIRVIQKVSFEDYLKQIEDAHILIDQCKTYDYGMNAILGMEHGLIVLSGSEIEASSYISSLKSPIININPNSDMIYNEIEKIILSNNIINYRKESLKYVNKVHDNLLISKNFESLFKSI